jgi:hypothetical protein
VKRKTPPPSSTETALEALREPDQFLQQTVHEARANVNRCLSDVTAFARREPEKALLSALAAGYVLRMLPVTGLARMFIRLALCLLKPAAFIYGGAKLLQKVQNNGPETIRENAR